MKLSQLPQRHVALLFSWLRRQLLKGDWRPRGTIDSTTGRINIYIDGKRPPKPIMQERQVSNGKHR